MDNRYGDPAYEESISSLKSQLNQMRVDLKEIVDQFPEIQKVIDSQWND